MRKSIEKLIDDGSDLISEVRRPTYRGFRAEGVLAPLASSRGECPSENI